MRHTWIPLLFAASLALAACQNSEERAENFFQSGLELREAGDLDRAAVEFRNVFRFDGTHREARLNLAQILVEQSRINDAYSQYLRLAEQYPEDADIRLELARLAVVQRAWSELERHGTAAIDLAPDRPESQAVAAMLDYIQATQDEDSDARAEALGRAETLLEANSDLDVARRLTIIGYLDARDYERALEPLNAALQDTPGDLTLNDMKLGALYALDRDEEVESLLRDLYARFPESEEVRQKLVSWYMERDDLDAVEEVLRDQAGPAGENLEDDITLVRFIAETRGIPAARAELARLIDEAEPGSEARDRYIGAEAAYAFSQGDREAAIARLQTRIDAVETPTAETTELKTMLAQMLAATGNQVGARALAEEVLEADATNVTALKLQAGWQIEADNPDQAISTLRSALDQSPRDAEILTLMARAHERAGSLDLAGERLALAVEVSDRGVQESLRYAEFLLNRERTTAARAVLDDAVAEHPQSVELLTQLGRLALSQNDTGTVRNVIATLERIESAPATDRATTLRAALLLNEERLDEGLALLEERASASEDNAAAVLTVIRARLASGQVGQARNYLDAQLSETPDDPALRLIDAALLVAEDDAAAAEPILRDLIGEYPQSEVPVLQLYNLLNADDRQDAADELLTAARDRMPESGTLLAIQASQREQSGDLEGALTLYEELYELNSGNAVAANNYASLLSNLRDDAESLDRAAAVARRLSGSDVPAFQDTYGWIAYLQGNPEEALGYLEPAAEGLPDNSQVWYHLGMTYAALDRPDDARTALNRALDLSATSPLPQAETARETLDGI